MNRKHIFYILFAVWLIAFAGSFIAFVLTQPTGDSFTRGSNRVGVFLLWQFAAVVAALAVWMNTGGFPRGSFGRWIGRLPVTIAALLASGLIGIVIWAGYARPPFVPETESPPREVTALPPKLD